LTLRELGEACGVSHAYLSRLERGEIDNPSVDVLGRIAEYFDLSLEWLVYGDRAGSTAGTTDPPSPSSPTRFAGAILTPRETRELSRYLHLLRLADRSR
jgi:transcriptional regulator with XRE-family HTH domain